MAVTRSHISLPPPPLSCPWLVFNHGEHGKYSTQTFFNTSQDTYVMGTIPELCDKMIVTCSHGWLVLLDLESDDCFLLNPVSMKKIMLPPLQYFPFFCCILSSPPTDPNCALIFVCRQKPSAMFCHLGDGEWTKQHLRSAEYFRSATVCGGKIYGITLDGTLLTVDDVGSNLVVTELGSEKAPNPSIPETSKLDENLVDSCGELFIVVKSYLGMTMKIRDIEVYKMDFSRLLWTKVDSLGDRTFFLCIGNSFSCSAAESGIKHNSIYYLEGNDRDLFVFDLENYSISFSTPCPLQKYVLVEVQMALIFGVRSAVLISKTEALVDVMLFYQAMRPSIHECADGSGNKEMVVAAAGYCEGR
ncbi:hypothetical protein TEA_023004 [Camellia sinensis var. sinensis]|uniref:KIB1-4 beta-propeller domain-containing protein n=1 Tax=Camellia sinensis var. sinensis TaxID=542762 RepID=A0A4S4E8R6_CAMSN|nr:hypothetical protein TEA_023004 [Camellia sinensis var. sinensis]